MSGLRPTDLVRPRPDATQRIDAVERSNNRQLQTRASLPDDETRLTFQKVFTERTSAVAHVTSPLDPDVSSEPLRFVEGDAEMPYQPPAAQNIVPEQVSTSVDTPARLLFYVDSQLFASVDLEPYGFQRSQIAGLAELGEFVDALDGSHILSYRIENRGRKPLRGSVSIRAIQIDLEANQ